MAKILAVNHVFGDLSRPILDQGVTGQGITIGDGAWIGAGAAILDGVRIGRGAVIGANAVVTADVPDHAVAVGVPARVIKRLDSDTAVSASTQAGAQSTPLPANGRRPETHD
jgi:acetyltransferase-like isoleucine patch superfamily enzyme